VTAARAYDVVVFGATGSTGRLVAEYLATASRGRPLRLALGGRDRAKLTAIAAEVAAAAGVAPPDVIVADAKDRAALDALAAQARVVATTVGPYLAYGSELVGACAGAGTHYADITGEVHWIRQMIDAHHATAVRTGARIVHCCGFDSIPSDLGVALAEREMVAHTGAPADDVTALFGPVKGKIGGGTAATMLATIDLATTDPAMRKLLRDPYSLDPEPRAGGPTQRDDTKLGYDKRLGVITAPFVMAAINTRIVRRTNALLGYPYGRDFHYREVMSLPRSPRGALMAAGVVATLGGLVLGARSKRLRPLLERRMPKPGEGPSAEERAAGHYTVRFLAERTDMPGEAVLVKVADRLDPGHGSTSKMLAESALCLAFDPLAGPGGILTPASAMGHALVDRLRAAGMTFEASRRGREA
jgi:short subunit dehydrogenase-like uncharacterized protein